MMRKINHLFLIMMLLIGITAPLQAIPQTRARSLEITPVTSNAQSPVETPSASLHKSFDDLAMTDEEISLWQEIIDHLENQWVSAKKSFSEKKLFLSEFIKQRNVVGAIAPSSSYLAEEMTTILSSYHEPIIIVEVGAGTGAFTEKIIEKMPTGSILYAVELNENYCQLLHEKFDKYENVHIECIDICKFKLPHNKKCDVIIAGLPFNAFPREMVNDVLAKYKQLLKRHGSVTFFEYIWADDFMDFVMRFYSLFQSEARTEFIKMRNLITRFKGSSSHSEISVLRNLPPARAITCYPNLPNVTSNPEVAL